MSVFVLVMKGWRHRTRQVKEYNFEEKFINLFVVLKESLNKKVFLLPQKLSNALLLVELEVEDAAHQTHHQDDEDEPAEDGPRAGEGDRPDLQVIREPLVSGAWDGKYLTEFKRMKDITCLSGLNIPIRLLES